MGGIAGNPGLDGVQKTSILATQVSTATRVGIISTKWTYSWGCLVVAVAGKTPVSSCLGTNSTPKRMRKATPSLRFGFAASNCYLRPRATWAANSGSFYHGVTLGKPIDLHSPTKTTDAATRSAIPTLTSKETSSQQHFRHDGMGKGSAHI